MTLSIPKVRQYLKVFDFDALFIEELGWDRHAADLELGIGGERYKLRGFAEKRGVQVFECLAETADKMPDFKTQRKIETQLRRAAREHLVIYTDATRTKQVWKPVDWRGHEFYPAHQSGDSLIEKLQAIQIPLDEEEALDLLGTVHKLRDAFDRDRITKKFYDYFQKEQKAFLGFIEGVQEQADREWYASLMLNRLMFVYFIQRKGFLDRDKDYLRNRLRLVQLRKGKGKFHTFYRYFLLALFHQGFSTQPDERELDAGLKDLLGDVPYVNGGLFDVHELEKDNPKIDIPDEAFERIFGFFDQYEWTLDTRPLRNDKEINPDVLGYIFEKYINQKQMGAYYTKEDITDYIGRNTIIPYLFDEARKNCAVAFQPGSALWRLLQETPDRYIYPAVRKGVIEEKGQIVPIPAEIEQGIEDVAKRDGWNRPASAEYALPTETWREYVARRQRCLEVREKLAGGGIAQINDLITLNLDIRRFAEDAILSSEGPELLRAFYHAITGITVLDPTCGSGAFLFAALNILEPLYEACLDRMQTFVEDLAQGSPRPYSGEGGHHVPMVGVRAVRHSPKKFEDFRGVLEEVARHPNAAYFVLKSIIVRNLYGVDIMEEAVEICKLRLFLKLVSQVDNVRQLEPLPDIDFNIRPGNTLVGFATLDDVKRTVLGKLADDELRAQVERIVEEAEIVDRAFQQFHEMQTKHGMNACEFAGQKQELRRRLDSLTNELDGYTAGEYGIAMKELANWRLGHAPFHWFAEFFGIMNGKGGFDVIIGNPPYVEYHTVREQYRIIGFDTEACGNLYANVLERCFRIAREDARIGMIVQLSAICTDRMAPLQQRYLRGSKNIWAACFDDRPGKLFDGLEHIRAVIVLSQHGAVSGPVVRTTNLMRWHTEIRPTLFALLEFGDVSSLCMNGTFPKAGNTFLRTVLEKIRSETSCIEKIYDPRSRHIVHYYRSPLYWIRGMDFLPYFRSATAKRSVHHFKDFPLLDRNLVPVAGSVINSSLFYMWFIVIGNGRNVALRDITTFPAPTSLLGEDKSIVFSPLFSRLMDSYKANSIRRRRKDGVEFQEFCPGKSKAEMDDIDRALAVFYSLTDGELDYVINYDIKYRLGQDDEEDDE